MSQTHSAARGGEFATSRRGGIDPYEIDFITTRAEAGCTDATIAKMLGRPVEEVRSTRKAIKVTPANRNTYTAPHKGVVARPVLSRPMVKAAGTRTRPIPDRARRIICEVCDLYDLTWDEMVSTSRAKRVTHPRQQAFSRLNAAGFPLADIGRYFGGMDHTSVLHGVRAHAARLAAEPRHIGEAE